MKQILRLTALLLAMALCLCACGTSTSGDQPGSSADVSQGSASDSSQASAQDPGPGPSQVQTQQTGTTETKENQGFDMDFLNYINSKNASENYIISPLSFRAALVLAEEGADGATREQLLNAMGFSSEEDMELWYSQVRESVAIFDDWIVQKKQMLEDEAAFYPEGEAPEMPDYAYQVLNSVWNNSDVFGEFLPDYVDMIAEKYSASSDSVPSGEITDAVNQWCDESTAGLIPKIADDLSGCAAALVNAVYLKSSWCEEFSKGATEPEDFTDIDGNVTSRDMMKIKDRYVFYEDADTKLVSIPLNGGLTLVAVLGDDSSWLEDYLAADYTDVDLWIPKLDTESSFGPETLVQYLTDRGAVDAFDSENANFSRMADYPWYIGSILQKAKIKTDEEGLEAAAVTAIVMEAMGMDMTEPQYKEFHATEPFRYYVVTTETQTPLVVFAGQEVK